MKPGRPEDEGALAIWSSRASLARRTTACDCSGGTRSGGGSDHVHQPGTLRLPDQVLGIVPFIVAPDHITRLIWTDMAYEGLELQQRPVPHDTEASRRHASVAHLPDDRILPGQAHALDEGIADDGG